MTLKGTPAGPDVAAPAPPETAPAPSRKAFTEADLDRPAAAAASRLVGPCASLAPMRDTAPAAEQIRLEAIRRLDPVERVRQALALSESMRALALAGLAARFPGHTRLELVEILLGAPLVPASARSLHR